MTVLAWAAGSSVWFGGAVAAGGAAGGDTTSDWRSVRRAARQAREANDFAGYRANLGRLYDLLNGSPDVVYALAKAEALLGHRPAALDWLRSFAEMGLARDAAAEPDLAALRDNPGFAPILARLGENRKPVSRAALAFTLPEKDLISEDLAYDPASRRFFVSSVRRKKILAIGRQGETAGAARDFVPEGRDGIWSVLALVVDARRRALWATTAAMPQASGFPAAEAGHSAVLRFDLATGKLQKRYDLEAEAGAQRVLGDMTLGPNGDVYVSESVAGGVYTISSRRDALETLVAPGAFISPQTPAATPDGRRLFVADYARGIGVVDLASRSVSFLPHPKNVALTGIDGLYLAGRTLFAVQNGTEPNRVVRLELDPDLSRIVGWTLVEANTPRLGAPTHGVVVGRDFYFLANSGWDQLEDNGALKPGGAFTPPLVLKTAL